MKLIFLGSGSAFTLGANNYHSNMMLEDEHKNRLMIDCGTDARFSLNELGLTHRDVTDLYISHLHADHSGGLEWLAFTTKFDPDFKLKPTLYLSIHMVDLLWENVLSGGLCSLEGVVANLTTYFNLVTVGRENRFNWHDHEFYLVSTEHVQHGDEWMPSYGLFFTVDNVRVFITTDMKFKPERYTSYYKSADIIFHDCETAANPSGVHPHYNELVTLDPAIKAKTWLYHANPGELPDAVRDGFRGFVSKGQCFDFTDKATLT